ncbi:MAG: hypothetical protein AB1730_18505 [Myxococcota bacterium]
MRNALWVVLLALPALAQDRPDEAAMFGGDEMVDAGAPLERPSEDSMFGGGADPPAVDAGAPEPVVVPTDDRDLGQLFGKAATSKFESGEVLSDALKIGGTVNLFLQGFWQETRPFEDGSFSAPTLFDLYLDGRPNDRVRGYVGVRLQYDPTRPTGESQRASSATLGSASVVGLTLTPPQNPAFFVDQLWLRFDIARKVFLTIGRQKVRWGVSRIWYPTDFLNSRPRDALNPFDVRLGVNMVKVHVPVESLGWNFYAYGLMDAVTVDANGITVGELGGALRGEFVLGPAEIGIGGVWQQGRRPRYAIDVSSAVGPFDVYAEAAFRDARDFVLFRYPDDLNGDNLVQKLAEVEPYRPTGLLVQVSGGLSWQFNYTDKNFGILTAEYFYNPAGYSDPIGYQVKTFGPGLYGVTLDPIQNVGLYGGQHNVALSLAAPGIPGFDWITVSLSNIVIINDPSAITRLDVIFRVLNYLSVQAFAGLLYGQPGGQVRFQVSSQVINDIANISEGLEPGSGGQIRSSLGALRYPPILQAGVLLRLAI